MVKAFKLPRPDVLERLRKIDLHHILDRYGRWREAAATEEFPVSEIADAVCALRYLLNLSQVQIADRTGLSNTQVGVLQHFAFVTNEVHALADHKRPDVDRLSKEDINLISRLPLESQPRAAKNLLSIKKKQAASKAHRAFLRGEKS
jgi:hypothetical protein